MWLFAIALGAAAPMCVRVYASALEQRARRRTRRLVALAGLDEAAGGGGPEAQEQTKDAGGCPS